MPAPPNRATMVRIVTTAEDFAEVDRLIVDYEAELPPDLRHADFDEVRGALRERYREPNAAFLAIFEGSACGCVLMTALDPTTVRVSKMYVQPQHRGYGIARELMEAFIETARLRGFKRVVLDTERDWLRPAYELYKSLGFTECAPYAEVDYATPTFMEKFL